jgi:hypothetical protein
VRCTRCGGHPSKRTPGNLCCSVWHRAQARNNLVTVGWTTSTGPTSLSLQHDHRPPREDSVMSTRRGTNGYTHRALRASNRILSTGQGHHAGCSRSALLKQGRLFLSPCFTIATRSQPHQKVPKEPWTGSIDASRTSRFLGRSFVVVVVLEVSSICQVRGVLWRSWHIVFFLLFLELDIA